VNILHNEQRLLADHFAGRAVGEPQFDWLYDDGLPSLEGSMATLKCQPWSNHEAGDHIMVLGRIAEATAETGTPLCFFQGDYRTLSQTPD
jgi:flavin reductase (DIM6/NTAB) family NADH-FMN oxidoreductase RutF